ncbi:hypothetical protein K438DRAFT_1980190 [Mycena galopus ATCC 62051]|nr:hypothetical protein K438DRAFT_1980190 [Mycena galopus ATCC 62051]
MSFSWRPTFWTPSLSDTLPFWMFLRPFRMFLWPFRMFLRPFRMFRPSELSTSDFRIWILTSGSGPDSRTLLTSLRHLARQVNTPHHPSSLFFTLPTSPRSPRRIPSPPPPGLPDVAYCRAGSCQILWPSHSTSALAPLSLPHPVVRILYSDF